MNKAMFLCALFLSGCGVKATSWNADGKGYLNSANPHVRPVCMLRSPVHPDFPASVIGIIKGNKQMPSGYSEVYDGMASEARRIGADAIVELKSRQDWAFRGIFILRPVAQGVAVNIDTSTGFNCVEQGGFVR